MCLFVLFEDLLYKKIRNDIIYSGAILVIALYLVIVFWEKETLPLKVLLVRFIISGIIGVGLWYFKGWSAGDAKLFWLLSLLFEIEGISFLSIFNETFIFLINIFLPVIPVVLFSLTTDLVKRLRFTNKEIVETGKGLLRNTVIVVIMMLISRVVYLNFFSYISQTRFNLISMLIVFFLVSSISRLFNSKRMYLIGGILFFINLTMLYIHSTRDILLQIYSIGMLSAGVIFIRIFYESVLKYLDLEIVSINKLRRGDLLSKEFVSKYELDRGDIGEEIGGLFTDGLTSEQVSVLKKHLEDRKVEYIERHRTFSFSGYIVVGYIFTFLSGFDNVFLFAKRLIGF